MPDDADGDNPLTTNLAKAIGWINLMRGLQPKAAKPQDDDPYGDQQADLKNAEQEDSEKQTGQGGQTK